MTRPCSRALALVLGGFLVSSAVTSLVAPTVDATIWLIDLRWLTPFPRAILLATTGTTLLIYAPALVTRTKARRAASLAAASLAVISLLDCLRYGALLIMDELEGSPLPFSLFVLALSAFLLVAARRGEARPVRCGALPFAVVAAAILASFPLAQMLTFGLSDYRRPADAILVFGARAYADGSPSDALADRIRTAAGLYHEGLADYLILSGGAGDGAIHETECMRSSLQELGVPPHLCILDTSGVNTRATLDAAAAIAHRHGFRRLLAVSHFYHLRRIKLQAQTAGLAVYTVPARQGDPLVQLPRFVAREVVACWYYYLRGLASAAAG
jgi:vancomycin permeability regulator SanA